jgi:ArsR family transcriptional regulator
MIKETEILFKGLSDETRLRIIALLLAQGERGELCVCDLTATLQLPQSTVSRHLAYLRKSGLVRDRRDGLWMYYSIERKSGFLDSLVQFLAATLPAMTDAKEDLRRLQATSDCNRCA